MKQQTIYIATHSNNQIYSLVNTLLIRLGHTTILNVHSLPRMEDLNQNPRDFNSLHKQSESLVYDINRSDMVLLVLPAGRGAHIETGIAFGFKKPVYILDLNNTPIEPLYCLAHDLSISRIIRTKEDLVRVFNIDPLVE